MTRRRRVLFGGLVALVASAAQRASGAPAEWEGGVYGGTSSGGWACGPNARVKYGGVGGEVRLHPDGTREAPASGVALSAGVAAEHRAFALVNCGDQCGSGGPLVVPPGGVALGGSAKAGYDGRWVGFRLGVNPFQAYADERSQRPTWYVLPEGVLRVGRFEGLRGEVGLGSFDVPTMTRPGLWGGLAYAPTPGWEIAAHGGLHMTFDGSGGARGDVSVRVPLADDLQLGLGAALSEGVNVIAEPEGRLTVIGRTW